MKDGWERNPRSYNNPNYCTYKIAINKYKKKWVSGWMLCSVSTDDGWISVRNKLLELDATR